MEPIRVPGPPKESFKKHRLISDLVRKQVEHFQHVESKLPAESRTPYARDHITTEAEAARYIAAITGVLCSLGGEAAAAPAKRGPQIVPPPERRARPGKREAIAAVAEDHRSAGERKARKAKRKKGS